MRFFLRQKLYLTKTGLHAVEAFKLSFGIFENRTSAAGTFTRTLVVVKS